jgi:hypothetical protein
LEPTKCYFSITFPFEIADVNSLVSKATKEAESGAIILFSALQLLETDSAADFQCDV